MGIILIGVVLVLGVILILVIANRNANSRNPTDPFYFHPGTLPHESHLASSGQQHATGNDGGDWGGRDMSHDHHGSGDWEDSGGGGDAGGEGAGGGGGE